MEQSGNECLRDHGSYAAADEMIVSRCGDRPGARRKEATPTHHTHTQRENGEREETQEKNREHKGNTDAAFQITYFFYFLQYIHRHTISFSGTIKSMVV